MVLPTTTAFKITVIPQVPAHSSSIKWEDFDLHITCSQANILVKVIENIVLKGTNLSCTISNECGNWMHRKSLIEKMFSDIVTHCPKADPLVIFSLGSNRLIMEYILGKLLIDEGFTNISFILGDPEYKFSQDNLQNIKEIFKDFRSCIQSCYLDKHKAHFADSRIQFLSRIQNVSKHFPPHANVAIMECLPPNSLIAKIIKDRNLTEKSFDDMLIGGYIVPSTEANAMTFYPIQHEVHLRKNGAFLKDSFPIGIFELPSRTQYYIDWGCKIERSGTYRLSFTGKDEYLDSLNIRRDREIGFDMGKKILAHQWIPILEQELDTLLKKQIQEIKGTDPQKELTQENITTLLEKVKTVVELYMPKLLHFFPTADYALDRQEALSFIASQDSCYRKVFTLHADHEIESNITVEEIT